MKKRLVILDTHAILHRAYHALPDFSSSKGEPTGALYGLVSMLVRIITDLRPDYIAAAFDLPGPTFRDAAYKEYKGTRAKTEDALIHQIKRSRDVLGAFGVPLYDAEGFEADDVVGTIVEQMKKEKDLDLIIASGDMDTLQLIDDKRVRVYTLRKGLTDTVMYDEAGVVERYGFGPSAVPDLKGIAGDASDNIKGVPGVGEGSALKLLQTYGTLEKIYAAIKKEGVDKVAEKAAVQKRFVQLMAGNKEEAQFSKMLATIRRDAPVDFKLPAKTWREGAESKAVLDMLNEFDFRSLIPRVKQVLGGGGETVGQNSLVEAEPTRGLFGRAVSPEIFEQAALAVWVLDTNTTEPTLEDIARIGKSESFDEAFANLKKQIHDKELDFVYEKIELPLTPVLRRMEKRGVKIDKAFLEKLSKEYTTELQKIAARIYTAAGGEFNIASPKQLGEVLFDRLGLIAKKKTAGGARSTRESELQKLAGHHPIIEDILSYRELAKLLSTYIDTIPALLDNQDRLHTTYIQAGTTTGRVASQNPNLQNIPIKTELGRAIRHAFVADKGMALVAFDYSQVELRIAAILSGDEGLAEIFRNGRDVHTEVASRVFHAKPEDVTYEMRRRAKVINFGILYGMGVTSLQQSLGTKRAEAQEFYNQYFAAFPKLSAYMDDTIAQASRLGYTQTLFGRRRYFDGLKSPIPYVKAAAERMALNAPFQGTAADLFKLAMLRVDEYLQADKRGYLLLQVHDELVFEVEKDAVGDIAPKLKEIMENVFPEKERRGIPVTVEGKAGKNWGDMQKL
ncbi:MAG: DNA polymerase [Patescibacteria group bacterium]